MRTSFHCSLLARCHYAHRLPVSEGLAVTFIVMLSKSVDYVQPWNRRLVWRGETPNWRETPGGAGAKLRRRAKFELLCAADWPFPGLDSNVRHRTDRVNPKVDS